MEFLTEYGMFLAKAVTVVIAIAVIIGIIASAGQRNKRSADGSIQIVNISDEINDLKEDMEKELLDSEEYKKRKKARKKAEKAEQKLNKKKARQQKSSENPEDNINSLPVDDSSKQSTDAKAPDVAKTTKQDVQLTKQQIEQKSQQTDKTRLFVLDFDGDVEASAVENLREEVTAVVTAAEEGDRVLLRLESPGGMVHAYGLAASQLLRLKDAKLQLVVSVDQVAASGGYMMACVADKIIAAPFAVVGSIGVIAELPNFHRLLKHNKVDYEQHTAGEFKRTLTMFAENTEQGREKFIDELEQVHVLFKQFINENRPELDVEKVATGEHWYARQALQLKLVDQLQTSDDYIIDAAKNSDVYSVTYEIKKTLSERLSLSLQSIVSKGISTLWQKSSESRLFK